MENSLSFGAQIGVPPAPGPTGQTFRIVVLGDFSGRANRGELDGADEIARRKPLRVEFDTLGEVLEELAPRLRIPIAGGRSVVELEFSGLDAFDADHLFGSCSLLEEAQGIRRRIERSVEKAVAWIKGWPEPEEDASPRQPPSRAVEVPRVEGLEELASLTGRATAPDDVDNLSDSELLEVICAPILRGPAREKQPSRDKLLAAAAECSHAAARQILHHPDFQALEGAWRELEWLLRRVERGGLIQVLFVDLSAEEFASDLARGDDLTETGLYRLLVGKLLEGAKPQPPQLIVGRYVFDYSPAHAAILGRMGKISERLNAPFLSGMAARLLDDGFKLKEDERLSAWNEMRGLPSSAFVGLALPGFLLRMPYGANGRSTDKFELEEVDAGNVQGSLLWGNAGTLCAALLGSGYLKEVKWDFDPNAHRVLDKQPLYVGRDADGDPLVITTEVQPSLPSATTAVKLGLIPLVAVKDRDSIQVSQIRGLRAADTRLCGAWAAASASSAPAAASTAAAAAPPARAAEAPATSAASSDIGGLDPELAALLGESTPAAAPAASSGLDPELAALLGESPAPAPASTDSGLDPELAALLGDVSSPPATKDDDLDPELKALLGE